MRISDWSSDVCSSDLRRFDLVQEATELLRAVAAIAFADDASGGDVERCEQGGHAVALVIMAAPLRLSWSHRQHRLAAVERLDLALFIDAQDRSEERRVG